MRSPNFLAVPAICSWLRLTTSGATRFEGPGATERAPLSAAAGSIVPATLNRPRPMRATVRSRTRALGVIAPMIGLPIVESCQCFLIEGEPTLEAWKAIARDGPLITGEFLGRLGIDGCPTPHYDKPALIASQASALARAPGASKLDAHAHRLGLKIILENFAAHLTAPARLLIAAERHRSVEDIVAIDPNRTGAQLIRDAMRALDVAGP